MTKRSHYAIVCALAAGLAGAAAPRAHAQAGVVTFAFASFDFGQFDISVTGALDGVLQSNGNTFDVTGIAGLNVNGTPIVLTGWTAIPFDSLFELPADTDAVTLNGTYLNFAASASPSANVGFGLGDEATTQYDAMAGWGENDVYFFYESAPGFYTWNASFAPIPEPAAAAAFVVGLAAMGIARRRRAA
jgi:hypothetical protein